MNIDREMQIIGKKVALASTMQLYVGVRTQNERHEARSNLSKILVTES